ncbi:MAG TPA: tRNA lysidine(34) synthetase TilS [Thermodesulfovibrionales bacterium]|nr:tRNA lysidine(34) synthetase TilS [Thermodesulfovibrionales bacterium]
MKSKQDSFIDTVRLTLSRHSMLSGGETVLVGLSGGPDSVCLLMVLDKLRGELDLKLHAIYIDHGLRPAEIPEEVEFCRELCEGLHVPFTTKAIDVKTYSKQQGMNKQEAARELRYKVFDEVSAEIMAGRIALGHTSDDQLETFFMRFFRGSGPAGLSGIPPVRGRIIRPLIEVGRTEIEEFLGGQNQGCIVDSSNLKEDYSRNKLRLSFIPEIKKINPRIVETVSRTMEILREEERYFGIQVTKTLMKLVCRKSDLRIELFLTPMESMDKVILRRVLRRAIEETKGLRGMGFAHIEDVIELIKQGRPGDRLYLPRGLRVIKNYGTLVITSEVPQRIGVFALNVPGEAVLREIKAVITATAEDMIDCDSDWKKIAVFDADKVGVALTVRPREEGDFFYPLGFGKRKKLQDFFVDEKVPRDERDSIPIIVSGNDIVWIAGYRGDERFRTTAATKKFLRLEFKQVL